MSGYDNNGFHTISIFELERLAGKWKMPSVCHRYLILEMKALGGSSIINHSGTDSQPECRIIPSRGGVGRTWKFLFINHDCMG